MKGIKRIDNETMTKKDKALLIELANDEIKEWQKFIEDLKKVKIKKRIKKGVIKQGKQYIVKNKKGQIISTIAPRDEKADIIYKVN